MPTINDLRQQAATIKNATQVGENTATRVGTTFETIADLLEGMGGVTNLSTIDIGSIDTLNTTGDMLVGTPNIYTLTKTIGANTFKVGTLFQFANNGRYDVAQVIVSQFIVDADGRIDTTSADQEVHIFYRLCKTMNGGSLPTPIGTWTTWTELGGSGGSGVTIDPYPTQNSGNAVSSGGVFERLQDIAPKVDISAIDDIDEYSDMLATKSPFYVVTKTLSGNVFRIGTLMEFANQGRYILYQILATDYVLNDDGTLDTTLSENGGLKLIWRMKQFSGNPPAGVTIGVWTTWAKFGDNGYQPDNEDIDLNASDQLQFANKAYDASAFSGLGRVYLRKNIVQLNLTDKYFDGFVNDVLVQDVGTSSTPDAILFDTTRKMFVARVGLLYYVDWSSDEDYNPITRDVNWNYNGNFYRWNGEELAQWDKTINQLSQAMVNTANTIYRIQYDYDLNGQTITLPAGCVLEFEGGSISNGNIELDYTTIVNPQNHKIFADVSFVGYLKNEYLPVSWFGVVANDANAIDSNSRIIEGLLDMAMPLLFPKGNIYMRNVNLDTSAQVSFKLYGYEAILDRMSEPSRNSTNFMNDGEPFFTCFVTKSIKRNITLKNIAFKCTENGYAGCVFNTTSNASYTNTDISIYVYSCLFSDLDYVVKHNAYGTYLTFNNCIFRRIRTAISFDKNCNLARLTNLSFFGVGQCMNVYGSKCNIENVEFDCIYKGADWETLDLYGIKTALLCNITRMYEEIYASHDSMYRYKLITYSNSRSVYLYLNDCTFPLVENTEKTARLTHIYISNVTLGLPCNLATIDCKGKEEQVPYIFASDLNMNGAEVLPYNITYNGNTIYSKNICSGARTMPIKVQNVALTKSTITANKYAFNFTFQKSDNLYESPMTDAQKLNGAYYRDNVFNSAYSPVVDIVGVLNIDSIKDASDNELTGKFKFYIAPNNWKQNGLQAEDLVGEFSYNSFPLRITFNERRQVLGHIYYGGYYFVIQYVDGDTNYIQFTNTSKVNGTISFEAKPVQNTLVTY